MPFPRLRLDESNSSGDFRLGMDAFDTRFALKGPEPEKIKEYFTASISDGRQRAEYLATETWPGILAMGPLQHLCITKKGILTDPAEIRDILDALARISKIM